MLPKATFIIRNNPRFVNYVKDSWHYFLRKDRATDCSITIRKSDVFIHTDSFYCVIFNDLKYISQNPKDYTLEMNKKARLMLQQY